MQLRARHNVAPIVCNVCAGQAQKSLPVDFPRTWDDADISTVELPLTIPAVSPNQGQK